MGAPIRIDDLARPRLPWPVRAGNALAGPLARRAVSLAPESLLAAASRREGGLADFGDDGFREPLAVFADALEREAELTALGRVLVRQLAIGLLATRLRLAALVREHPEIRAEPIRAPLVILGLPRTGTTHLHNLLAALPAFRGLPFWESLEPIPSPAVRAGRAPDARRRRCAQALRFQDRLMPLFPAMHEMTPDAVHEEIQLLAVDFRSMLFESSYAVPSYGRWYRAHDQAGAYAFLRLLLQALQWLDRRAGGAGAGAEPRRWLLKSPQHLEQVPALLAAFPDARLVQTHRDPVRVTASTCTMVGYALRVHAARVDPRAVGAYWAERIEAMLTASLRDRPAVPPAQALDVRFDEFLRDEVATALRACAFAGVDPGPGAEERLRAYQDANPRGRHGTIDYRLEDFGLDAAERRAALRAYSERFGVPDEAGSLGSAQRPTRASP